MNQEITDFLAGIYPFSGLPGQVLEKAGSQAIKEQIPTGRILALDQQGREALYIIMKGSVNIMDGDEAAETLIKGDFFGHEFFFFSSPMGKSAVAVQDSTLIILEKTDFSGILSHDRVNRYFRRKAEIFRSRIQDIQHWRSISRLDPYLRLTLQDVKVRVPVYVQAEATVSEAAKAMLQEKISACLVRQDEDVVGIVTENDILRKIVAMDLDPKVIPVSRIMCSPLITIRSDDLLFQAFSKMVRRGIRRLVIMDSHKEARGIIEERDLLSVKGENPVYLSREISRAGDFGTLKNIFQKAQEMVVRSVSEGIGIFHVGRMISDMHDQIMIRVNDLILAGMEEPAPVSFCIAALGSEGRREQYLATDQDNLLIHAETDHDQSRIFFEKFSGRYIQALLDLGFPPCPNEVMISSSAWRMSIDQWLDTVDEMIHSVDLDGVLKASLMLDMRPVVGDGEQAWTLKSYLVKQLGNSPFMLKYMANEALRFKPPLGFFSHLIVARSGKERGRIDIKKGGVFPVTQGVRTLAAEHGILETSTEKRILRLQDAGVFSAGLAAGIREAYEFFQTLRVRTQVEQVKNDRKPDNLIAPDRLSAMERDRLKDCFKMVMEFQSLLNNKYGLQLLP